MRDVLSIRDIRRSSIEDTSFQLLAIAPRAIEEHAAFVLRAIERDDHATAVALGYVAPWERALAMVSLTMRVLDAVHAGRFPSSSVPEFSRLPYVAPGLDDDATPDERLDYLNALEAEELGYTHDPSWTNGGYAAHGAEELTDQEREDQDLPPAPNTTGIAAFGRVWQVEALPELAWYHSASARELGISSCFDAMVLKLLQGRERAASSGSAPDGPTPQQIAAAALQRTIRGRLGKVSEQHQAVLEHAYTDRRYPTPLVGTYGVGVAALVWRAAVEAGEVTETGYVYPSKGALRELTREVRHEWPTYGTDTPKARRARTLEERILHAAQTLLWTAHECYRVAAGIAPMPPKKRRQKARKPALVVAGTRGRKRRQLVEVPREAA